jgi:NADH:ubiquinone oxidoreductase subunit 6 (subunit J)
MVRMLLFAFIVVSGLIAVLSKDLFTSVISLGAVSVGVGGLYFALGLNYAGAFELNVGAGLTTVMFVAILGMITKPKSDKAPRQWFQMSRMQIAGVLITIVLMVALGSSLRQTSPLFVPTDSGGEVGLVLWKLRAPDIMALGLMVFSGALGISAMFHRERGRQDA